MARGASQQQNKENKASDTYVGQGATAYNAAMPAIQKQIANPGFDPVTSAAIRRSGIDTANSAFDAARLSASQRAGATGNEAMFYGSADQLAQKKAAADATAATTSEVDIGKQKLASQQQAIQDASQLYNFANTAGDARASLATQSMEARPSVLDDVGSVIKDVQGIKSIFTPTK